MKHILQGVLPPAIHDMITCSKQTTCSPLAFHQKGALGKCQDEHEGHHPSAQEGPHRLLKSIIDGSDLFAPRHGAESPAARSTRVVLCRAASNGIPLPLLLYRVARGKQVARRPARGLSSLVWSMSGLPATFAELEPCFPILLMSSFVASSELLCRALFSRMGASHSMGTAALRHKPGVWPGPAL